MWIKVEEISCFLIQISYIVAFFLGTVYEILTEKMLYNTKFQLLMTGKIHNNVI